jgi:hypothetical protein
MTKGCFTKLVMKEFVSQIITFSQTHTIELTMQVSKAWQIPLLNAETKLGTSCSGKTELFR